MNFTISYVPHSVPQRRFHRYCGDPEKKVIALLSGIRFGKTWAGRAQLARWILEQEGGAPMAWIVGPNYRVAAKACREFRTLMEPLVVRYVDNKGAAEILLQMPRGLIGRTPERYYTVSVRSALNPGALVSEEVQWVWMDEGALCPEEVFENCMGRLLHTGGKMAITSTPPMLDDPQRYTWIASRICDRAESDPTIGVVYAKTEDNPDFQTEKGKQELEQLRRKLGPQRAAHLLDGKFVAGSGLLVPEFEPGTHTLPVEPVPEGVEIFAGIDFGVSDPAAVVYYAAIGDQIVGVGEIFLIGQGPDVLARAILSHPLHPRCVAYYADAHGGAERRVLYERGVVTWPGGSSHVETYGILRDLLTRKTASGGPKLAWHDSCSNTIRELRSCRVPSGGLHRVRNNHCIDATRYALYTHLVGKGTRPALREDPLAPFRAVPRHRLPPSIERKVYGSISSGVTWLFPAEKAVEWTYGDYGEGRYSEAAQ